jgi:phosphate transport system substrate-binding protein
MIKLFRLAIGVVLYLGLILSSGGLAQAQGLEGTVKLSGSTSLQPLAMKLAEAFRSEHPQVNIAVSGGGSSVGIREVSEGMVDIGMSSRELTPDDPPLLVHPICRDVVAIIVNPQNPLGELTIEQLAQIYAGEITDWSQVGGERGKITMISREEGSGTRACFEEKVMKGRNISPRSLVYNSNGTIRTKVARDAKAIGYVSLGYVSGVKPVAIEGVEPTIDNCKSGDYPVVRRLLFLTCDEPEGVIKAFIDFCQGDAGQKVVAEAGYVTL